MIENIKENYEEKIRFDYYKGEPDYYQSAHNLSNMLYSICMKLKVSIDYYTEQMQRMENNIATASDLINKSYYANQLSNYAQRLYALTDLAHDINVKIESRVIEYEKR